MAKSEPRIDAYIDQAADFAKPILSHVRSLVHKAVPDAEETLSLLRFHRRGMCRLRTEVHDPIRRRPVSAALERPSLSFQQAPLCEGVYPYLAGVQADRPS